MGLLDTVIANKFIKTLLVADKPCKGIMRIQENANKGNAPPNELFKAGAELMYGGQGKITSTTN